MLYDKWREEYPSSTKTLEDVKNVVTDGGRLLASPKVKVGGGDAAAEIKYEDTEAVKQEESSMMAIEDEVLLAVSKAEAVCAAAKQEVKEEEVATAVEAGEGEMGGDDEGGGEYQCQEVPAEPVSLPREKWICAHHYIHVFYDDEDKAGWQSFIVIRYRHRRTDTVPY